MVIHLPIGSLKTRSRLEPVPICEPRTYQLCYESNFTESLPILAKKQHNIRNPQIDLQYTVKPAFAATSIWRPPVHGGHPEVPPMHFTIYFTSIWQPPAQRGQRPHFCAKKAKMNLLSRPQLFFSARYKEMSAIVKKKSRRSLS